jgi:hypothetical protein
MRFLVAGGAGLAFLLASLNSTAICQELVRPDFFLTAPRKAARHHEVTTAAASDLLKSADMPHFPLATLPMR